MPENGFDDQYASLIAECDQLIKAGQMAVVAHKISQINPNHIPRLARLEIATICRRIDLIGHGLRFLRPLIRNEKKTMEPPSPAEICEYSSLLARNGSTVEAMSFLKSVLSDSIPKSYLYLAHCHISNWDYELAIPLLLQYLDLEKDNYSKLVASVNLVPAYLITSQWEGAERTLLELLPELEKLGARRLLGNCFGFEGRLRFSQGDYSRARESFEKAIGIFGDVSIFDRLFIQKWQSIVLAFEKSSTEPLMQFRQEALIRQDWESVREADLYRLKINFDQQGLDHLTFGTPMSGYRRRIEAELNGNSPSPTFLYGADSGSCLDLETGVLGQGGDINPGKKIHQFLAALVKDFYAPRKVGALFFEIYPDEYFDPISSPTRLSQIIKRTRQWLKDQRIPAEVVLENGMVRLSIHGSFGIRLTLDSSQLDTLSILWKDLKSKFPPETFFSALEACQKLNLPRTSFHRVADYALRLGELEKKGSGKATRYVRMSQNRSASKRVA